MRNFQILFTQPLVAYLGWTLLHFVWQGVLVSALYAAVRGLTRRWIGAEGRYLLGCLSLAVLSLAPIITFGLVLSESWQSTVQVAVMPGSRGTWDGNSALVAPWYGLGLDNLQRVLPWLVVAWFTGVVVFLVRLVRGTFFAAHLQSMGICPAPHALNELFEKIATQLGVVRPARLLISSLVEVPIVIGWLRPLVLVPVAAFTGLAPQQIEALLAHELAHIRRHDYLVNVLQRVVEAVLFYHPAVWWVSNQIRKERELCCDDVAVAATGDALSYAHALADLEASRPAHALAAIAANGGTLIGRIRRLVEGSQPSHTALGPLTAFSVTLIVLSVVGAVVVRGAQISSGSVGVVERNTIWVDTVKRGDMPIDVRGLGVLTTRTTANLRIATSMMKEVQVGQSVSVRFADHREVASGRVTGTTPAAKDVSVAVAITSELPAGVQQGVEVDGTIQVGQVKNVLWMGRPVATHSNSTGNLFKLEGNGDQAVRVKVEFGRALASTIEIRSGLEAGDKVILSDMAQFKGYDRITLK